MDVARFLSQVPTVFEGRPHAGSPIDPLYARIVNAVAGYTSANELAVLNLAARLLPEGEAYLEVGTYKGRSMCAAVQGVPDRRFYAIENYLEFGMLGAQARAELDANLATWAAGADVRLIEGNCFTLLRQPGLLDRRVGVYFYDGEHTATSHYLALGVVEPWLADEALILVDDATYPMVSNAHDAFVARHPNWRVEERWDASSNNDPRWANGLHALRFDRVDDRPYAESADVRMRRLAYAATLGPGQKAAWKAIHRFPGLIPAAKKLYPSKRSSSIA